MALDERAYAEYWKRSNKADELYGAIRELYGKDIPLKQAYLKALRDGMLSEEDKALLREFYTHKM